LELIFNEPSNTGLSNALTTFWKDLQELAKKPEDMSARSVVKEQGVVLAKSFRHVYGQITQLQHDLNQQLDIKVDEINSTAHQIADLNDQIGKISALGDQPNDLLDQRELLVQKLSTLTNIEISSDTVNQYNITISGRSLVSGTQVTELYTEANPDHQGLSDVKWTDNHENVQFRNGSVLGVLEVRDDEITSYQNNLNDLASAMINEINKIHQVGYGLNGGTGIAFFTGDSAENIDVSQDVQLDIRNIAASLSAQPGDGENATAMASLFQKQILNAGTATFANYYSSMIARLGVDGQKAQTMSSNQELLVSHLQEKQDSVAGVSLDEEMANMIKFQNAYNAAARLMTTMNDLLDNLINRMGAS
jgi:flagellar hook-associated protein 1 FlgK